MLFRKRPYQHRLGPKVSRQDVAHCVQYDGPLDSPEFLAKVLVTLENTRRENVRLRACLRVVDKAIGIECDVEPEDYSFRVERLRAELERARREVSNLVSKVERVHDALRG